MIICGVDYLKYWPQFFMLACTFFATWLCISYHKSISPPLDFELDHITYHCTCDANGGLKSVYAIGLAFVCLAMP